MRKIGRETRLIGYDNDINIHRREAGKPSIYRIVRPRTIVYCLIIAVVGAIMLYALMTRSLLDVNVLHDRNPIAVRLSDGSIRNAYTVRLLNKHAVRPRHRRRCRGSKKCDDPYRRRRFGDAGPADDRDWTRPDRRTTSARHHARGRQSAKSIPVKFHVTDIGLGEAASATDNFVAPWAAQEFP